MGKESKLTVANIKPSDRVAAISANLIKVGAGKKHEAILLMAYEIIGSKTLQISSKD